MRKVKKVLLFKHSNICYDSLNAFSSLVAEQLTNKGIKYEYIDITESSESIIHKMNQIIDDSFDVALAFNAAGQHNVMADDENIFDKHDIPFYNWLVDHPISQPHCLSSTCHNYHLLLMDQIHAKYINQNFPRIRTSHFLPLGGLPVHSPISNINDRQFDISFPGGYHSENLQERLNQYNLLPEASKQVLLSLIDYSISNKSEDITQVLDTVLHDTFGINYFESNDFAGFIQLAAEANRFMRIYYREEILNRLVNSKLNLHIFGGQARPNANYPNVIFHDNLLYMQSETIFNNSKIVLNIMPCFKSGTHDRISSSMLHKTLSLTDHSFYLDSLPQDTVLFYDLNDINDLPDVISDALNNPEYLQYIADNGFAFGQNHFSWEATVEHLLNIIEREN